MSNFALLFAATEGATGGMGDYTMIIWLVVMVGVFYFLLWRPQKKREKADRQLRANIAPGDSIVTIGGFVGKVLSIKDDDITIETGADRTKLTIKKWAIQTRTPAESKSEEDK